MIQTSSPRLGRSLQLCRETGSIPATHTNRYRGPFRQVEVHVQQVLAHAAANPAAGEGNGNGMPKVFRAAAEMLTRVPLSEGDFLHSTHSALSLDQMKDERFDALVIHSDDS